MIVGSRLSPYQCHVGGSCCHEAIIDFWPLVMTFFMIIGSNDIKVSLYEDNRDLVFLYFCAGVCYISSRPWLLSHGCNSIARVSFACFPSFCSFPIQLVAEQSIHFGRDCWSTAATLSRSFEPFEFWPGEVSVGMTWSIKEIFKEKQIIYGPQAVCRFGLQVQALAFCLVKLMQIMSETQVTEFGSPVSD